MGRPALAPLALRLAPHGLALAVIGGLVCSLAFTPPVRWAIAALLLSGLGAGAAVRGRRAGTAMALIALALGLAGLSWGAARIDRTAPQTIETFGWGDATVVVDTPPAPDRRGRQRMRAVVETIGAQAADPATRGARILLSLPGGRAVAAGDRLRVAGRLRPAVEAGDPGWWRAWLERQGISGRLASAGVRRIGRRGGPAGWRDVWRNWATDHVAPGLEGDTAGLVRGMALGGGARLSARTADDFRDAGIWHLLAVSGQNVTVVCLAVLAVLRALGLAHRPALVLSGVVMGAYVLACDGGASVARAGTVGALALVGELLARERDRWLTLLVGLALLLAWQPRDLLDPGLQLSFAAVCGLFALTEPLAARLRPWTGRRLAQLAGASLAASLATAPVVAGHFGRLSLIGLPVNLVAVPLAAPIVVIALAGLPAGVLFPPAGALCAALAGWGADLLALIAHAAASLPAASVPLPTGATPLLATLAALAVLFGAGIGRPILVRRTLSDPRVRRRIGPLLVGVGALLSIGWMLWPRAQPAPWPTRPAVTALDVGQGDALLLRGPGGETTLIDAGPPGEPPAVIDALARHGVRRIDLLVVTHADVDHSGGAPSVIERFPVGALIHPPRPADGWNPTMRATFTAAARRGTPTPAVRAGDHLRVGPWELAVLSPRGPAPAGQDPNDTSVVLDARTADGPHALLTGDAESAALRDVTLGPVDLLKVAHHGSQDPGLEAELAATAPRLALISAGRGNPFGHPRADVLAALGAAGVVVRRTDRDGDITVTRRDGALEVALLARR